MKSLINLWRVLAYELAKICHTSAARDVETVARRVEHEGMSFLTITLPSFAKDFEKALDRGKVTDDLWLSFRKAPSGLPRFLGGFLQSVFDTDGHVNPPSDTVVDSIFAIRQLSAVFGKIELECTSARQLAAIEAYRRADEQTGRWDKEHEDSPILDRLHGMFRRLYADVLTRVDQQVYDGDIIPSHGPGAVAEGLRGNAKYLLDYWPARLDAIFPYMEYGVPGYSVESRNAAERVSFPEPEEEIPSRVILVPKTMKTPRVIAAEPAALQYMQQGIARALVPLLEDKGSLVHGMIGFTDQIPNQELAQKGSLKGELATLDMSEASDRVSYLQVVGGLSNWPWLSQAVKATRSQSAKLPSGEVIPIQKFASMGSALCFPMEAMVFLAAVFLGIENYLRHKGELGTGFITTEQIESYRGSVRVYGDDIIVPVDSVYFVLDVFAHLGWKTNVDKSFWTGSFRESCGADFYAGRWVTPIRFRRMMPRSRRDVSEVASLVSFRNQAYTAGLWETAKWLDPVIGKILPHYPVIASSSAILGRVSFLPYQGEKDCPRLHSPLVRGYSLKPRIPSSPLDGVGALLKCLLTTQVDPRHLERFGRPSVVDMKLKWSSPF